MKFFLDLKPPTVTAQMHRITVKDVLEKGPDGKSKTVKKPRVFRGAKVNETRALFATHLAQHIPMPAYTGPLRVITKWLFPVIRGHRNGSYKSSRPDLDNINKILFDCMTELKFWHDDAQIASLVVEKFWADKCGIIVEITEIDT